MALNKFFKKSAKASRRAYIFCEKKKERSELVWQ
jgi:hypothetical protein